MEDELTRRMHSIAFRATKAECLDLPSTTDIIRKVELEPRAMKLYQSLVKESYAELSDGEVTITNVLTKLLRLSQLTGGFIGSDESSAAEPVSTAKLDVLEDIIDSAFEEEQKAGRHRPLRAGARRHLPPARKEARQLFPHQGRRQRPRRANSAISERPGRAHFCRADRHGWAWA
jgi:hypothetical protein